MKDIEESVVSGKIEFRETDWNPPKREGRGGESPNVSPKGFTALVNGIEKPIPIGKVVGRQQEVGNKRRSEEVQGKQAWRPPGRC